VVARPVPRRGRPAGADDPGPAAVRRGLAGLGPGDRRGGDRPRRGLGAAPQPRDARVAERIAGLRRDRGRRGPRGSERRRLAGGLLRHAAEPGPEARPRRRAGTRGAGFWASATNVGCPTTRR
jgi:hypothetical protein